MLTIHGLLDDEAVVVSGPIDPANIASLTRAEARRVEGAVAKRRNEFASGRAVARAALAMLGRPAAEILSREDRVPIWPQGVYGSISHSDRLAVVAVTESPRLGDLGIDIEQARVLDRDLWSCVFLPAEVNALDRTSVEQRRRLAVALFSAKEAFYKAQYAQTRCYLDFHAVHVELTPLSGVDAVAELRCTFQVAVGPFAKGRAVLGRYLWDSRTDSVLTAVSIAREPA